MTEMDDTCKDCRQAKVVDGLSKRIELLEGISVQNEHRITTNEERTKQVFSILTEIKDDIKTISTSVTALSTKLTTLESKPGQDAKINQDATKSTIWTVIITAAITVVIAGITTFIMTGKF